MNSKHTEYTLIILFMYHNILYHIILFFFQHFFQPRGPIQAHRALPTAGPGVGSHPWGIGESAPAIITVHVSYLEAAIFVNMKPPNHEVIIIVIEMI